VQNGVEHGLIRVSFARNERSRKRKRALRSRSAQCAILSPTTASRSLERNASFKITISGLPSYCPTASRSAFNKISKLRQKRSVMFDNKSSSDDPSRTPDAFDPSIEHVGTLGSGAFGVVYLVSMIHYDCMLISAAEIQRHWGGRCHFCFTELEQSFARKVLHSTETVAAVDIWNEVRSISQLCHAQAHRNILCSLGHGTLDGDRYYYLDMELCDFNLEKYMTNATAVLGDVLIRVWDIMNDIKSGLSFLYSNNMIHGDLKPPNGMSVLSRRLT